MGNSIASWCGNSTSSSGYASTSSSGSRNSRRTRPSRVSSSAPTMDVPSKSMMTIVKLKRNPQQRQQQLQRIGNDTITQQPITEEQIRNKKIVKLACNHVFHINSLRNHVDHGGTTCPNDRTPISGVDKMLLRSMR